MELKKCARCKVEYPLNEFGRNVHSKDNLNYYCLVCAAQIRKQYYIKRREMRGPSIGGELRIYNFDPSEIDEVYKLLELLGYDKNKDIHQQFIDKNNPKYGFKMKYKTKGKDRMTKHFDAYHAKKNPQ